jgi:hypothetical protein
MVGVPPVAPELPELPEPLVPAWPGLKVEAPPGCVCAPGFCVFDVGGVPGVRLFGDEPGCQPGASACEPTRPGTEPTGGTCEPTGGGCEPMPGVVAKPLPEDIPPPEDMPLPEDMPPVEGTPGVVVVPVVVPLDVPVVPVVVPEDVCANATPALPTSANAAHAMRFMNPVLSRRASAV